MTNQKIPTNFNEFGIQFYKKFILGSKMQKKCGKILKKVVGQKVYFIKLTKLEIMGFQ